ncbi:MAG: AAA family ATPase [Dechloromonas sp.]|nr:MAG: AAA family ATPase [Dechloromonas sp.]
MKIHQTRDVFTPTRPARIAFVEREAVNDKLVNALTTPGKQIVVYGHSGSGKTTLLVNKLNQLYEGHLTSRCMKSVKFEQLVLDAFDQLAPYYTSERSKANKNTVGTDLTGSYLAIQSKINSSLTTERSEKEVRILPPQLTPQALGKFIGQANQCWVLEDFHKVDEAERSKLSQLMKVFMDLSDEYPELKIIALGAVDTARQVVDYDPEMRYRISEVHVDLMTAKEIEAVIEKGEQALNVVFPPEIKALIARYSTGLASVCHHICLNMCDVAGIKQTMSDSIKMSKEHFESAIKVHVEEASDSIRSAFDKALKQHRKTRYDNATMILKALSSFKERGASRVDIHNRVCQTEPRYPAPSLKNYLPKLTTPEYGGIVRYDSNSGLYSFSDPIYRAFALAHFRDHEKTGQNVERDVNQLLTLLTKELMVHFPRGEIRTVRVEVRSSADSPKGR